MIPNCNITKQDIQRAEESVKGKTTRYPTQHVIVTWTQVSDQILEKLQEVTLAIDIMAIDKIPFMITTSRHIHFRTAELIHKKDADDLYTPSSQGISCEGFQDM